MTTPNTRRRVSAGAAKRRQRGPSAAPLAYCLAGLVAVAVLLLSSAAHAQDSDRRRVYLGLRFEASPPGVTKAKDVAGASLGVNLDKHIGAELALDSWELKVGDVAELSVLGILPQLRLRYPLWEDCLVPYFLAGVGLAVTQGNDARAPVDWRHGKNGTYVMGAVGGGLEYFLSSNMAIGIEGKYLPSGNVGYQSADESGRVNVSTGLLTMGLRVLYPELGSPPAFPDERAKSTRLYLSVRTGGSKSIASPVFDGLQDSPEQHLFGSDLSVMFGASLGANFGSYWGFEVSLDNYEIKLADSDGVGLGEYAIFSVGFQPRLRYRIERWGLEPYLSAGVGGEFAEFNDRTAVTKLVNVDAKDVTPVGSFAAGLDYFVMSNFSIGVELKYIISRGHTFQIEGEPKRHGDLDALLLSIGVRAFLFEL